MTTIAGNWCVASYRIAKGLYVEFSVEDGAVTTMWDPAPPARITGRLLRRYREARDHFLRALGVRVAVVEVVGDGLIDCHTVEPVAEPRH